MGGFVTSPPGRDTKYCDEYVCLSISKTPLPNFTKFSVHIDCGHDSFFLRYIIYFHFCV